MKAMYFFDEVSAGADEAVKVRREPVVVCVSGPPGCGKTSLLEATARALRDVVKVGVILANSDTPEDVRRLAAVGAEVIGIEEREISQAHLGELIGKAKAFPLDVLLVECARPAGVAGGVNVGVFSVSGGDDKPMKYPEIVQRADVVLLNKIDLMPHVAFNATLFEDEVKELNDRAPLLKLSAKCAVTLTGWIEWLGAQGVRVRSQYEVPGATIPGFYCG